MKKLMMVAMAVIVACSVSFAQTTDYKQIQKERYELKKMSKKELNEKSSKAARKEAKRLAKEGWQVNPGMLPMEKQLDRAFQMQMEYDENLFPKYIMGEAKSIGESYDAAKTAALSLAITNLAGQIQTEVTALVENTVANKQLSPNEAASIVESIQASKNLISQSIGRTIPVMECFRTIKKTGNTEVQVRIAYNAEMAKAAAKKAVREELEKKGQNLHDQLDKALGL
ncbi:MAG: hypothetical protein IJP52_04510 [Paludibacteraceae bacterium]|nr:hypothetical protein [Paludibacteraceae bacterium]